MQWILLLTIVSSTNYVHHTETIRIAVDSESLCKEALAKAKKELDVDKVTGTCLQTGY